MNKFSQIMHYAAVVLDGKDDPWITIGGGTNAETGEGTGRKFQIEKGTGKILKGGGAGMQGKTFKEAFSEPKTERQKVGRKIAEAGAAKHGGNERDYRNLGVTKGAGG